MNKENELYKKELVLISDARNQCELFKEVGDYLFEKNLVTERFTEAICEREKMHPTGLDLSLVADSLPNVAIPHTDAKYCKARGIVFVKLKEAISFRHMIKPDESLDVRYLFFIINHVKEKQSTILSNLMEFITTPEHLEYLETLDTEKEIYEYISIKQRMDT